MQAGNSKQMARWLEGGANMAAQILRHDWSATSLGALEHWPDTLKTTLALCLSSRFPQAVLWGPELITFHNDAFARILGAKPAALGRPFSQVWEEAWTELQEMTERALAGRAIFIEDFPLTIERGGYPERAYFTFCYSPIRDRDGKVVGLLDTVTETTDTVVANRRLSFLDDLGRAVATATDPALIMAITTRMLGEHLGLSSCVYGMMDDDGDGDGFTIHGNWVAPGSAPLLGHYHLTRFGRLATARLHAGQPLVINDNLEELEQTDAAAYQSIGVAATICVPLVKDGKLSALMAVNDKVPRRWNAYEQALIGEVTERCWAHIQRVQAAAQTRAAIDALGALNARLEEHVSERTAQLLHTEAALRQAQKLEAIGQLTGGVAHDFNNLLTIMRSSLHFIQRPGLDETRRERYLKTMADSIDRGAKLTGQLLAFARRQALSPEVLEAGSRLETIADMLDTATGARVRISLELPQQPCHILADLAQLETAIINLVINGRDAMTNGGILRLRLESDRELPGARTQVSHQGPYAAISVIDTGVGIAPELLDRIFDPFFTTKATGQGTGLGLSQVFGFAKQSGGEVQVASQVGHGTIFTLYLPQVEAPARPARELRPEAACQLPNRPRRVLVVEDNPDIGNFTVQMLEEHGYQISLARSAEQAIAQLEREPAAFEAVFSDIVMPGMSGLDLARRLRRKLPQLPLILTSGYSEAIVEGGLEGCTFVSKPYSAQQICRLLDQLLAPPQE